MTTTGPFTERLSETWLIERTYHAQLRNGKGLSVPDLTHAMSRLTDLDVPLTFQSPKSRLPERLPPKKSSSFYVPLSAWQELSREEASAAWRQDSPILLHGEHSWSHSPDTFEAWGVGKNMREIISEGVVAQPEVLSGIDYAVCYLDRQRGTFSNSIWKAWFASDPVTMLEEGKHQNITFFAPVVQFPYTTHYTVLAAAEEVHEYASAAAAIEGFQALPRGENQGFPLLCYYHEVSCPGGVYRIEFFGPHMDEEAYRVKEAAQ